MSNNDSLTKFDNPLDTVFSAASRFAIELVAWIAGPWAAADSRATGLQLYPPWQF
ncbi:MAG: hypothetical protein O2921_06510 [Chloroflexi bacterium]|nr:hypothetical protein [Chloroflexota bacterium]MDA1282261.1 hypothetical protein [Chloroflexota bacterium]